MTAWADGGDDEVRILEQHGIRSGEGGRGGREAGVSGGEASVVPLQKLEVAGSLGKVRLKWKSKKKSL